MTNVSDFRHISCKVNDKPYTSKPAENNDHCNGEKSIPNKEKKSENQEEINTYIYIYNHSITMARAVEEASRGRQG